MSIDPQPSHSPTEPVTVVTATIRGWPWVAAAIRTHLAAAEAAGGHLLVVDGSGEAPPAAGELGAAATWLSYPGESVYQLRARAYQAARGEVVAVTEDHCFVPADWAARMVRAHRDHPDVVAIGGSIKNGTVRGILDWASFLIVLSHHAAPIVSGPATRISGPGNVSYKRAVLQRVDWAGGLGANDALHQEGLLESGGRLLADDGIRVVHDQSLGLADMTALHFHAARTSAAFWRRRIRPVHLARLLGAGAVPIVRLLRIARRTVPRGYRGQLLRAAPAMLYLLYVHEAGQMIGYALGAGDSPAKVQ